MRKKINVVIGPGKSKVISFRLTDPFGPYSYGNKSKVYIENA